MMGNTKSFIINVPVELSQDLDEKANNFAYILDHYKLELVRALSARVSLDDVKEQINNLNCLTYSTGERVYRDEVIDILDKIEKGR